MNSEVRSVENVLSTTDEDGRVHKWAVEPHPFDSEFDVYVTDDDQCALEAIQLAAENAWDRLEPGQRAVIRIRMSAMTDAESHVKCTEPGVCPYLRNTDHNPLYCEHCTGQQPAQPESGEVKRASLEEEAIIESSLRFSDSEYQMAFREGYVRAMTIAGRRLTAAQQRIRELESLNAERNRQNAAAWTRVDDLRAALLEAIEIMVQGEHLLPKGEARFRAILEGRSHHDPAI